MPDLTVPHVYLSTGCLHGDHVLPDGRTGHQYCQSDTGKSGAKKPSQCKFCGAGCICPCHRDGEQPASLPTVIHETPDSLRAQRARLIASTGIDETVLRERAAAFQLYPEHAAAWRTVESIDYLLAGEPDPITWAETVATTGSGDTARIEIDVHVPGRDEPEPMVIPRDAAILLHRQLGDLLQGTDVLDGLRDAIYARLNREGEFVGCPDEATDDIMQLITEHGAKVTE